MSGLAAGIRLAMFERKVLVLERHSLWGGLNSFYKQRGRRLDVGLHALTNWAPARGAAGAPLSRILRQLRLRWEDLELGQQSHSEIHFPGLRLRFSNDFALFEQEIAAAFPAERERFAALVRELRAFVPGAEEAPFESARSRLRERLRDPLLIDALLLPTCYYGSPLEQDIDWAQFRVLFQALFFEGLARPRGGIHTLLELLRRRYAELGGELRLQSGVARLIERSGSVQGVVLDDGSELEAERVFSSAGLLETARLCSASARAFAPELAPADWGGELSFLESIFVLDRPPAALGLEAAVLFFNARPELCYARGAGALNLDCSVISCPGNYAAQEPAAARQLRLTVIAEHAHWSALRARAPQEYAQAKLAASRAAQRSAARFTPDWEPYVLDRDVFTPATVERFTGHHLGRVYGSIGKLKSGCTGLAGLFLIGTDQGNLGIVGALMSGIAMVNRHALASAAPAQLAPEAPRA